MTILQRMRHNRPNHSNGWIESGFNEAGSNHCEDFFNEVDAIFGKRKADSSSKISQIENALQNILLEALENFNGIFIATTNVTKKSPKRGFLSVYSFLAKGAFYPFFKAFAAHCLYTFRLSVLFCYLIV
jgi:hypothetical protein